MKPIVCSLLLASMFAAPSFAADVLDNVRIRFAKQVYASQLADVHDGQPQALLRAVVALRIKLAPDGRWAAEVERKNHDTEMTLKALQSVVKLPVPDELSAAEIEALKDTGFVEIWLFDSDGRFALRTLAREQRGR